MKNSPELSDSESSKQDEKGSIDLPPELPPSTKLPVKGILTIIAAFVSFLMIGSYYTFGNVMPYMVSYMRTEANITVTYADFATVQLVGGILIGK